MPSRGKQRIARRANSTLLTERRERMREAIEGVIKKSAEDLTVSSKEAVERLLLEFEHQTLFDTISAYMRNPDIGRREWIACIETLCRIDRIEANKRFVDALQVEDADKRFRLVKLLGKCGTEYVVPSLISILKDDPHPGIRFMAAHTLGAIGDARALSALKWSAEHDHALNHEDVSVSEMARIALEMLDRRD